VAPSVHTKPARQVAAVVDPDGQYLPGSHDVMTEGTSHADPAGHGFCAMDADGQ
jgi:hypothetical protein